MGRPPTRPIDFRDGFYIEIRNKGSNGAGIKIRRDDREQMLIAAKEYRKSKDVIILGEYKNGKPVKNK